MQISKIKALDVPFETAAKRGQGFQVSIVHSAITKLVKEDSVEDQESDEQEKVHAVGNSLGMSGHCWDCGLHISPNLIPKISLILTLI